MSDMRQRVSDSSTGGPDAGLDPHYLAFFDCFNAGRFFEAHEVLESLWLPSRGTPDARFYQGLIQLAGAFVHLENQRPAPAVRLFRLQDTLHGPLTPALSHPMGEGAPACAKPSAAGRRRAGEGDGVVYPSDLSVPHPALGAG